MPGDAAPTAGDAAPAPGDTAPADADADAAPADAAPPAPPLDESASPFTVPAVELHGFINEGGFWSTANQVIGDSSRGSLELFEAGLNASSDPVNRLHVGMQLYTRDTGDFRDAPYLDWAFGDYQWKPWLGVRVGITKMPFGLYNESVDAAAGRVPILLPQSVYPIRNRGALQSQTGVQLYGNLPITGGGELDYEAWYGTLTIPRDALTIINATLDQVETRYVTGAQVFWSPPVDGLRVGATFLRAVIDFHLTLDPALVQQLIAAGLVDPSYDGKLRIAQLPTMALLGSVEYLRGPWAFAAEYGRWLTHQVSSEPMLLPPTDRDAESFYGMASYRADEHLALGSYYAVSIADVHDRGGHTLPVPFHGWQRDLAGSVEYDVNDHWLWKLEGHFVDGTADLPPDKNADPVRFWGLFLVQTAVTF